MGHIAVNKQKQIMKNTNYIKAAKLALEKINESDNYKMSVHEFRQKFRQNFSANKDYDHDQEYDNIQQSGNRTSGEATVYMNGDTLSVRYTEKFSCTHNNTSSPDEMTSLKKEPMQFDVAIIDARGYLSVDVVDVEGQKITVQEFVKLLPKKFTKITIDCSLF